VPAEDTATWAQVARETSGAFAAWSLRVEPTPGPLAATARQLARSAQLHAPQVRPRPAGLPSAAGVASVLASAGRGGRGRVGEAVGLRQLANTAQALHDAHAAAGEARTAQALADVVRGQLASVARQLGPNRPADAPGAQRAHPDHRCSAGCPMSGRDRAPGSVRRRRGAECRRGEARANDEMRT
jgi:hypothetical protein